MVLEITIIFPNNTSWLVKFLCGRMQNFKYYSGDCAWNWRIRQWAWYAAPPPRQFVPPVSSMYERSQVWSQELTTSEMIPTYRKCWLPTDNAFPLSWPPLDHAIMRLMCFWLTVFFYLVGWDLTPIRSFCRSPRFVWVPVLRPHIGLLYID
jgi:hypothetical protein